jgi:hypothetical protein
MPLVHRALKEMEQGGMRMRFMNGFKVFLFRRLHFIEHMYKQIDDTARAKYEHIYEALCKSGTSEVSAPQLTVPVHEFLHYLVKTKNVVLHGTTNGDIEVFEPRDQTTFYGKHVKAVFATTDAIWPTFYATLDRKKATQMRNGCFPVGGNGSRPYREPTKFYFFAIPQDALRQHPWVNGFVYVLPRTTFVQSDHPEEWISYEPVVPLIKIPVSPQDFIFQSRVEGCDPGDSMPRFFARKLFRKRQAMRQ